MTTLTQDRARLWAGIGLLLLGVWIVHGFLVPLAWAVVLGLTTWPLYDGLQRRFFSGRPDRVVPALLLTLGLAAILFGPVTYGLVKLGHEAQSIALLLQKAHHEGLAPPAWLGELPGIGAAAVQAWNESLGTSASTRESLRHLLSTDLLSYTRALATQVFHRYAAGFFTLVVLFFIYRHGAELGRRVLVLTERWFGDDGNRYALHAARAVTATVNGIVLVALGQGILLGFGYAAVGFQHATILGVVTALVALIPFAAKIIVVGAALILFAGGHLGEGVGLLSFGLIIIILSDNYLKPKLIGDAVKLPFVWTLLGILGGIETFGLLGLFFGPTVMAILMSVWRDSCADSPPPRPKPSC
jgi:predicted PurR-regulated permease PerM